MNEKVKVTYVGPNAKEAPRELLVTPDEADRLIATKLFKKATSKKKVTAEGANDG